MRCAPATLRRWPTPLFVWSGLVASLVCALPPSAQAQPSGAVERRFQDQQLRDQLNNLRQQQLEPTKPLLEGAPSTPSGQVDQPKQSEQGPPIKGVELNGAQLFPANRLALLRLDFVGRSASQANLQRLQAQITAWYDQAKLLTQVGVPRYGGDGVVSVQVVEARLGAVRVDQNRSAISSGWAIATVLDAVGKGREMRLDKLESALLKLNDLGGVQVRAALAPGKAMGTTDVVLTLKATRQVQGDVSLNNYVTQYTGPYQAQANVNFGGLLGRGETFVFDGAYSGNVDWYGSRHWAGNGIVPLTPGGLNWVGSYSWSDYRLLQEFAGDNYVGDYMAGTVGLSQVLWRRPKANLVARVIGEVDTFNDSVLGYEYSNRTNWVGRFSLAGDIQDQWFGGAGLNSGLLTLSLGNLSKLAPGEADVDAGLMGTAGSWGKINLLVDRYQMFKGSRWSLEFFGQAQGAFNNLDSAEKMSLGWPNGVRAYPPGEAAGDSGLAGQFTARYQIAKNVALKGFVDGGYIWRWTNYWYGMASPGSLGLWGPGLGVDWGTRGDLLLSVDLAFPMGQNFYGPYGYDVDGENPDARVWVSLRKWL